MTKRDAIEQIMKHNPSARPEFLSRFSEEELRAYLRQLESIQTRPCATPARAAATTADRFG